MSRWTRHLVAYILFATGCGPNGDAPAEPLVGPWHMVLDLGDALLPVTFELHHEQRGSWNMTVKNGDELIDVSGVRLVGDSIYITWPLYDSEFRGLLRSPSRIEGYWFNRLRAPDYRIPFVATAGLRDRFASGASASSPRLAGSWEATFSPGTADGYSALGIFRQFPDGIAQGTFLTETGDYRYLEGRMTDDSLMLSGFNGSQAFLFRASLSGDSLLGTFHSGTHWQERWVAVRNPGFKLRSPDSLTFLKPGHERVDFRFPDLDGRPVSPRDETFRDKVLVVQIMGSWCPNCVDETRLLNELYEKHHADGLEMISVAFEKPEETERAIAGLKKFKDALRVRYPILYAGTANKAEAAEKLPFLDHVLGFPTCVISDHTGRVRRILTGINGPGTGDHYISYKQSLEQMIRQLIEERRQARAAG